MGQSPLIILRPYLITFTTYGARLPGDERGTVERGHNLPGMPRLPGDPAIESYAKAQLKHVPVLLDHPQRQAVRDAIVEVCNHRRWKLRACNVRSNHVHAVAWIHNADRAMNDFKSYGTRMMKDRGCPASEDKTWTRHGSTRHLHTLNSRAAACDYVMLHQGDDDIAKASWRDMCEEREFERQEMRVEG